MLLSGYGYSLFQHLYETNTFSFLFSVLNEFSLRHFDLIGISRIQLTLPRKIKTTIKISFVFTLTKNSWLILINPEVDSNQQRQH